MSNRPPYGAMVYWRFKQAAPTSWRFGYCTDTNNGDLVRMGCWNGDTMGGSIVSVDEIEWKPYR